MIIKSDIFDFFYNTFYVEMYTNLDTMKLYLCKRNLTQVGYSNKAKLQLFEL